MVAHRCWRAGASYKSAGRQLFIVTLQLMNIPWRRIPEDMNLECLRLFLEGLACEPDNSCRRQTCASSSREEKSNIKISFEVHI